MIVMKKSIALIGTVMLLFFLSLPFSPPVSSKEIPESQEVVIFIPGLLGTELYKDEKKLIWLGSIYWNPEN